MAFWNNKSKLPPQLDGWEVAKEISKAEAEKTDLPIGWYIYKDGYVWYGLRPNEAKNGMERSYHRSNPKELEGWLGKTILLQQIETKSFSLDTIPPYQAVSSGTQKPSSPQISDSNQSPPSPVSDLGYTEPQTSSEDENQPVSRKDCRRKRNNELHFWLSDRELVQLKQRVKRTDMNLSEFIRKAILTGKISIEEQNPLNQAVLDEVLSLRAEMGRIGGMLKMVIRPNEGQRELAPDEWKELIQAVRYLERTKERLANFEEKFDGNHQASHQ